MTTARAILDAAMSETQLQRTVIEMAQRCGWLTFHLPDAALAELAKRRRWQEMPEQGFPDTVLVHPEHPEWPVVVAELKTEHGLVRPPQRAWLDALDGRTVRSVIWRPRDLDAIERVLSGGTR